MPPLTPEQERERLELIQEQNKAAKELASTYEKMAKTAGGLNAEEKEILDISKKISKVASEVEKSTNKRLDKTSSIKDLNKSIQTLEFTQLKNADIANKLEKAKIDAINESLSARVREIEYNKNIAAELDKQQEIQDRIEDIKRAEGSLDKAALAIAREELKDSKAALDVLEKGLKKTVETKDQQRNLAIQLDESAKAHQRIIEEQKKELELTREEIKLRKQKGILNVLEEKFNIKQFKDTNIWVLLFKTALDAALKFNEISVNISKSLGYGTAEADRLAQNMVDVVNHSDNINVTLKNAGEAMTELNDALGLAGEYSADALETQIMLTKQFRLTGEEAAGIYKFSLLTGQSSSAVNKSMVGAFVAARNQFRSAADFKKTIAEAAKVSGILASNFQNNPAAIVKAVVQAKALGTTLEQTAKQGEHLLDFQSSIESELKAELLTGKELNLERARAAALAGDQVTLAEELAKNIGDINEFDKMNVLQKKAMAEALGLSSDELANQVRLQKIAKEQGKSIAQVTEEEAQKAQERQTIQDKFNNAILKLQDLVGNLVAGPFGMLLDALSSALTFITWIAKPFQFIYDVAKSIGETIAGWIDAAGPFGTFLKMIAGIAVVLAAYGAYAALAWIPIVGPVLGAVAAAGVIAGGISALSDAESAGDMISPADGRTQVSTKEGGLFELSKNDDLLAGPGLADKAKGGGRGGESIAPSIDLTPMIAAINEVRAAVDRLYSKDTSVNMDGKKVGSTLTQGSYKVA